jgi:mono/diheme cytochrome c family protein
MNLSLPAVTIKAKWHLAFLAVVAFPVGHAGEAPDLSGPELFATFCASCHGPAARGDGPIAPILKIAVPDLTLIAARRGGKYSPKEMQRIIDGRSAIAAHGTRDMPVWGDELYAYNGQDRARRRQVNKMIAELVAYLGSLQTVRVD